MKIILGRWKTPEVNSRNAYNSNKLYTGRYFEISKVIFPTKNKTEKGNWIVQWCAFLQLCLAKRESGIQIEYRCCFPVHRQVTMSLK